MWPDTRAQLQVQVSSVHRSPGQRPIRGQGWRVSANQRAGGDPAPGPGIREPSGCSRPGQAGSVLAWWSLLQLCKNSHSPLTALWIWMKTRVLHSCTTDLLSHANQTDLFLCIFWGPTYFIPMFLCCEYLPLCACQAGSGRQLAPCACLPTSKTRGEQRRRRLTLSCSSAAPASASSRSRCQSPPSVSTSRSRGSGATRAECQISVNSFPNSENRDGKSFYMLWNWKSSASSIDSSKNWICECSTSWWSFQTALLPTRILSQISSN